MRDKSTPLANWRRHEQWIYRWMHTRSPHNLSKYRFMLLATCALKGNRLIWVISQMHTVWPWGAFKSLLQQQFIMWVVETDSLTMLHSHYHHALTRDCESLMVETVLLQAHTFAYTSLQSLTLLHAITCPVSLNTFCVITTCTQTATTRAPWMQESKAYVARIDSTVRLNNNNNKKKVINFTNWAKH